MCFSTRCSSSSSLSSIGNSGDDSNNLQNPTRTSTSPVSRSLEPQHRPIQRQKSRLPPAPKSRLQPAPMPFGSRKAQDRRKALGEGSKVPDYDSDSDSSHMSDEAEIQGVEIPRLNLQESNEPLIWSPPVNLYSPLMGVYHSGYPMEQNYSYLKTLELKSILSLVTTESETMNEFMKHEGIKHFAVKMAGTDLSISTQAVADALEIILDKSNHPILFFSGKGKHRVGVVLGTLRKITSEWSTKTIVEEYQARAGDDIRDEDINFITDVDVSGCEPWYKEVYGGDLETGFVERVQQLEVKGSDGDEK